MPTVESWSREGDAHAQCLTCSESAEHLPPESGPQRGWARRHAKKTGHEGVAVEVARFTFYERSGS